MPARKALVIDGTFITVPVIAPIASVLSLWVIDHAADLDARLEPHGLTSADLALPEWHRLVYAAEVDHQNGGQS